MIEPTTRQLEVLRFFAWHQWTYDFPPSLREIMDAFNWKSPNAVMSHITPLERKGYLVSSMIDGKARRYRLTKEGWSETGMLSPSQAIEECGDDGHLAAYTACVERFGVKHAGS